MSSDSRSLLRAIRSAFEDLDEVVRFNPKSPAGANADPKALRKGQAALIRHPAVHDKEKAKEITKKGGPDMAFIAHGALKAAGATRRAAKVAQTHGLGREKPSEPEAVAEKPHVAASHEAHAAHREAHGHGETADASRYSAHATIARDAFVKAHDKHVAAAQHLVKAGQRSTAQDHVQMSKDAAHKAMEYHSKAKEWGAEEHGRQHAVGEATQGKEMLFDADHEDPIAHARALSHIANAHSEKKPDEHKEGEFLHAHAQKATYHALKHIVSTHAGEPEAHPDYEKMDTLNRHHRKMAAFHGNQKQAVVASRSYDGVALAEQRRLMGMVSYPTLKESATLAELEDFNDQIKSWQFRQRDLMGLGNQYPSLNEAYEPPSEEDNAGMGNSGGISQGALDVNYQLAADRAARCSTHAHGSGAGGDHETAALAHAAAAKLATSPEKKTEHQALSTHHTVHATRSPEMKMAQVTKRLAGESFNMGVAARQIAEGVDEKVQVTDSPYPAHRSRMANAVKKIGALPGQKRDIAALLKRRHPSGPAKTEANKGKGNRSADWVSQRQHGMPRKELAAMKRDLGHTKGKSAEKGKQQEATDTRDIPQSVKDQAKAIEKNGHRIKKRGGGATTKAGIAYAIAWKHHCKANPGSRHCHKTEDAQGDKVLGKLAKKHGADEPVAPIKKAAVSTLDKLKRKYGEKVEDAASDELKARKARETGNKLGTHYAKAITKAKVKSTLDKLKSKYGEQAEEVEEVDEELMSAVEAAWEGQYGKVAGQ